MAGLDWEKANRRDIVRDQGSENIYLELPNPAKPAKKQRVNSKKTSNPPANAPRAKAKKEKKRAPDGKAAGRRWNPSPAAQAIIEFRRLPSPERRAQLGAYEERVRASYKEDGQPLNEHVRRARTQQLARLRELADPSRQDLFAREELDQHADTLFVDEGGQFALADALAVGTAAQNLVLLGDPNQLPQVSQGSHPPGAEASVLGHLLGEDETLRPGMGVFLEHTWRLRPEVNAYVSETFYEGRLEPADVTSTRSIGDGNGVRFLQVVHSGHRTAAPEEAKEVAAEIERLVGTPYAEDGVERPLGYGDFMVVAPYNSHVRCLREALPEAVRVGTVDKFQGQESTVSFFSMASSSGEDVPRGIDFLFSRNRLNVAVSRARCLAYLVASPRLLDTECRTVEQMKLVNALCRFAEVAEGA